MGYINDQNLVEKVETWLENPIFGDMLVEALYTEYRDANGLKYPATIVQKRGGSATFEAQILGVNANPTNIAQLVTPPAGGQRGGPPPGGRGRAAAAPTSEKLADGVYRINGAYNAMAIEFKDHIVLFEGGPQTEARSMAIIAEAKKVIPNKPIRYSILTHHHFDHSSGLPAVVAEGATIITHEVNKAFLEKALNAPRTLAPDAMSKSGKKPKIETVTEKRVLQDETRTVEIHHVDGSSPRRRHADGVSAEGEDSRLRRHVQPAAGRQSGAESTGRRHDGLPREHGAVEARTRQDHVGALAESRSTRHEGRYSEIAGKVTAPGVTG